MHAAGSTSGMDSIWSSIRDIRGLMTIDRPSCRMDERIYVRDFPDPVSDTNIVERWLRILLIVSNCPNRNYLNPQILPINFSRSGLERAFRSKGSSSF